VIAGGLLWVLNIGKGRPWKAQYAWLPLGAASARLPNSELRWSASMPSHQTSIININHQYQSSIFVLQSSIHQFKRYKRDAVRLWNGFFTTLPGAETPLQG
jgi:hypothetical protein